MPIQLNSEFTQFYEILYLIMTGEKIGNCAFLTNRPKLKHLTEIEKEFRFEAAHKLPHVPEGHKCARLHGHSFRIVLRIQGPLDPILGWVMDFQEISKAFSPLLKVLDHSYLNEIEGLENPTCEVLAHWIAEKLSTGNTLNLTSVTVKETCSSACTVYLKP